eukprot:Selendium_serpulae@DN3616_c0_g1_i1.p2
MVAKRTRPVKATRSRLGSFNKSGGKIVKFRNKRKYELGRNPAHTKLSAEGKARVVRVRVRGGSIKRRAIRLCEGLYSWPTQGIAAKSKIIDVVYNASSNEFVREKALTKNTIVLIDAHPFKKWYQEYYNIVLGKKKTEGELTGEAAEKAAARYKVHRIDDLVDKQFKGGRLLACIASRPGQTGKCDGYILEGDELAFYKKKLEHKKGPKNRI